jgi:hypothetical protein
MIQAWHIPCKIGAKSYQRLLLGQGRMLGAHPAHDEVGTVLVE